MAEQQTVYVVGVRTQEQLNLAQKHCFGDCGKIKLGIIDTGDDVAGPGFACTESECLYEKAVIGPMGTAAETGQSISIRVLQEIAHAK